MDSSGSATTDKTAPIGINMSVERTAGRYLGRRCLLASAEDDASLSKRDAEEDAFDSGTPLPGAGTGTDDALLPTPR